MLITRTRSLIALAACATLIAACSSDDAGSTDTQATTPESATAETTAATEAPPMTDPPATTENPSTTETPSTTAAPATPDTAEAGTSVGSISDVAIANGATFIPGYTSFASGYDAAINGNGPVTALMPSDEGFISFSSAYPDLTEQLRADLDALDRLLQYHVIDGALLTEAMETGTDLVTLQGEPITVEVADGAVVLNGGQATISTADLEATNGVVHILDGILLPPSLAATAG